MIFFKKPISKTNVPPFKIDELRKISFGGQQGEKDKNLKNNFVITGSVSKFLKGDFNYVLSPKGFGKSALFCAIKEKFLDENNFNYNNKLMLFINEAFGYNEDYLSPKKFKNLKSNNDYTFMWALYFLNKLIVQIIKNCSDKEGYSDFVSGLSKYEYLKREHELFTFLEKVEKWNVSFFFNICGKEMRITPKLGSKKNRKKLKLNDVFFEINNFLNRNELTAEIYIDRVDKFVSNSEYKIQKNYIQGLFDTVEEISQFTNIKPVLFLRTDLFYSMEISYEHDKVRDRIVNLRWSHGEILNFLLFRLLSNKYIEKNYVKEIERIMKKIFLSGEKKKLFERRKKYNLKKNLNFRMCEKCLHLFLPKKIHHCNDRGTYEVIELTDWLFTHFSTSNGNINPRCLIWFFNNLFEEQYNVYIKDIKLTNFKEELEVQSSGDSFYFQLFLEEVIEKTYKKIQNDELKTIYGLLKSKEEKEVFKKINYLLVNKMKFSSGDIILKDYNINKDDYRRLIKYLTILGFLNDNKNKIYNTSIIFQKEVELDGN